MEDVPQKNCVNFDALGAEVYTMNSYKIMLAVEKWRKVVKAIKTSKITSETKQIQKEG